MSTAFSWPNNPRPTIQPRQDLTQSKIEEEILRLSEALEEATGELGKLLQDSAKADATHKLRFYQALLQAEGKTQAEREARAHIHSQASYEARKMTEAVAQSAKERCHSLRSQLSALQTLSANVRGQT